MKEVIDEIANLVCQVLTKDEHNQIKDFEIIARILVKLKTTPEGRILINEMKLSFGAFEKLKNEMMKFEFYVDPNQFAFDSELPVKNIKSEFR